METSRIDCGTPECVTRTLILDSERPWRTERFEGLPDVKGYNRGHDAERSGVIQRGTQMSRRMIVRTMHHEALKRMYREAQAKPE